MLLQGNQAVAAKPRWLDPLRLQDSPVRLNAPSIRAAFIRMPLFLQDNPLFHYTSKPVHAQKGDSTPSPSTSPITQLLTATVLAQPMWQRQEFVSVSVKQGGLELLP
jgi:hypothetical protein